MFKIVKIILGINLISYSVVFYVMYLNLFSLGYDLGYYLLQVVTHFETLLVIPGVYFICSALQGPPKNDMIIRR